MRSEVQLSNQQKNSYWLLIQFYFIFLRSSPVIVVILSTIGRILLLRTWIMILTYSIFSYHHQINVISVKSVQLAFFNAISCLMRLLR